MSSLLHNRWFILFTVILAFTPIVLDMTILHIAVPSLTAALHASGTEVLWILDIYPLIMAGLLIPMGTLGDRIGHRHILLTGLLVFSVASTLAAFSITASMLILSRGLLAVGAAMILPGVLAIIRNTFEDPKERALALGIWSTIGSAGAAIGPLTGGFLLEHFWWGSVFLINLPVMLFVFPLAYFGIPQTRGAQAGSWRISHALLLLVGLIAAVYTIKAGARPETSWTFIVLGLTGSFTLLAWFGRLQWTSDNPLLDLSLFLKPAITVGILMAFVVCGSLAGFELLLAQELQYVYGRSPLQAGMFMLPLILASGIAGPVAGKLFGIFGLRPIATIGLAVSSGMLFAIAHSHIGGNPWVIGTLLFILGFALGSSLLASSIAIMSSVTGDKAGAAGSLEGVGYELGAGMGITFFGVLVNTIYRANFATAEITGDHLEKASSSIGEAIDLAHRLGGTAEGSIISAAQSAFSSAHSVVLMVAASLVAVLTVIVFITLRGMKTDTTANH